MYANPLCLSVVPCCYSYYQPGMLLRRDYHHHRIHQSNKTTFFFCFLTISLIAFNLFTRVNGRPVLGFVVRNHQVSFVFVWLATPPPASYLINHLTQVRQSQQRRNLGILSSSLAATDKQQPARGVQSAWGQKIISISNPISSSKAKGAAATDLTDDLIKRGIPEIADIKEGIAFFHLKGLDGGSLHITDSLAGGDLTLAEGKVRRRAHFNFIIMSCHVIYTHSHPPPHLVIK